MQIHDPAAIHERLAALSPRAAGRVPTWVAAACLACGLATSCTSPKQTTPDTASPRQPVPDEPAGKPGVGDMYAAPKDDMGADMDVCHECMEYAAPPVAEYGGPPVEDE